MNRSQAHAESPPADTAHNAVPVVVVRCDALSADDVARFGDVHERTGRHIEQAAASVGVQVAVSTAHAIDGELPTPDPRALYVLTGSKFGVLDDEPWIGALIDWVRRAHDAGARLYGICFGHQVVATALGGRVGRSEAGWDVGCVPHPVVVPTTEGPSARTARRLLDALAAQLGAAPASARLLMSHRDEVVTLPVGAVRWLGGATWPEQGFVLGERVVTVQGHPEYEAEQVSAIYERRRALLGDALADRAIASTASPHDGLPVSAAVLTALLTTPTPA